MRKSIRKRKVLSRKKKHYGGMDDPEINYIQSTHVPTKSSSYYIPKADETVTFIPEKQVITEDNFGDVAVAEPVPITGEVEGVTYAPKSYMRNVGKTLGLVKNKEYPELSHLDFDLNLLKGTCLETMEANTIPLTIPEISIFKEMIDSHGVSFFTNKIQKNGDQYCKMRSQLLQKDPMFYDKYPSFFKSMLIFSFYHTDAGVERKINEIKNSTQSELKAFEHRYHADDANNNLYEIAVNRSLYREGSDTIPLPVRKIGGIRRNSSNRCKSKKVKLSNSRKSRTKQKIN